MTEHGQDVLGVKVVPKADRQVGAQPSGSPGRQGREVSGGPGGLSSLPGFLPLSEPHALAARGGFESWEGLRSFSVLKRPRRDFMSEQLTGTFSYQYLEDVDIGL